MSTEVRLIKHDDLDDRTGADVQEYEFMHPNGDRRVIDLCAENLALFEQDMLRWYKASRPWKRAKGKAKVKGGTPGRPVAWTTEIHDWATEHGYDWDDKAQRTAVREWAAQNGHRATTTGVIAKATMEAHYEAREAGEVEWPFSRTEEKK